MQDFYIECAIGGSVIVKVTAESLDKAMELSALMTIDDFESAGQLKLADVRQEVKPYEYTYDSWIQQIDDSYENVEEDEE